MRLFADITSQQKTFEIILLEVVHVFLYPWADVASRTSITFLLPKIHAGHAKRLVAFDAVSWIM